MKLLQTRWRKVPLPHFPEYEVSSKGEVRNTLVRSKWGTSRSKVRILKPDVGFYLRVTMARGHEGRVAKERWLIHRLVAIAFLGPIPEGMQVNHKNGDKHDNRVENLEYVSQADNLRHARRVLKAGIGVQHPKAVLDPEKARYIRNSYPQKSTYVLARELGVSGGAVWSVLKGLSWVEYDSLGNALSLPYQKGSIRDIPTKLLRTTSCAAGRT
jgi:hypothetical protein